MKLQKMKLRTLRRYCQTQIESSWMRIRSRFVDVEKLSQRVDTDLRFGVVVLEGDSAEQTSWTIDSVGAQVYPDVRRWPGRNGPLRPPPSNGRHKNIDFVAILDPGIVLEPDALLWAAIEIGRARSCPDWIYFDHVEPARIAELAVVGSNGIQHSPDGTNAAHAAVIPLIGMPSTNLNSRPSTY